MQTHEKIRELRERQGWTQEDMADKLSLSVNGYAKIERGETRLTLQRLEQVAQIFDVDLADMFYRQDLHVVIQNNINNENSNQINIYQPDDELLNKIKQLELTIKHKDELIANLKEQIADLRTLNQALGRLSST